MPGTTDPAVAIRPAHDGDGPALLALWQETLGDTWPLRPALLARLVAASDALVAVAEGRPVGLVLTQLEGAQGSMPALLVAPARQRQGIGRRLHDEALARLQAQGTGRVQLGAGEPRLWPGVPTSLPGAQAFFAACGWQYGADSYDMVRDLADYRTPPGVHERAAAQGVALAVAVPGDVPDLLRFVEREFPEWLTYYRGHAAAGELGDLLLARSPEGAVVAALILMAPDSRPSRSDVVWQELLGQAAGALGAVGVADRWRRCGIGTALIARGTELIRERGAAYSFIGWTWALEFYGRLGYRVWQEYAMSWRELAAPSQE
jgi:ribosomal protein S18 acetylase RimI-like enzyme